MLYEKKFPFPSLLLFQVYMSFYTFKLFTRTTSDFAILVKYKISSGLEFLVSEKCL